MADKQAVETTQNNPFAVAEREQSEPSASASQEQERAVAEVKASVTMAMQNPRQPVKAMDRILQECQRPTLAEQAVYAYPRGGQQVTGPSIRLAEALARNWGNIDFGIKELENKQGRSMVLAYAWDMETNTRASKTFVVEHKRVTKNGEYPLTDPRDIYEMIANQGARRLRACILSIVPGDVVESAVNQCDETTKHAMGAPEEKIKSMLEHYESYGVTKQMIERRLGHRLEAESTVVSELLSLHKIYTSIKDGYSKVGDWFETEPAGESEKSKSAKDKVQSKAASEQAELGE